MEKTSLRDPSQREEEDEASQHSNENSTAKVLFTPGDDPGDKGADDDFYMGAHSPEAKARHIDASNQKVGTGDKHRMDTDNQNSMLEKPKDLGVEPTVGRAAADFKAKEQVAETGKSQKNSKKTTEKRMSKNGTFSQPPGRAPSGKIGKESKGEWAKSENPPPVATKASSTTQKKDKGIPRPRGRPPKGTVWDQINGKWITSKDHVDTAPGRHGKATKLADDAERPPSVAKPSEETAKIIGMEVDVAKTTFHVKGSPFAASASRSIKNKGKTARSKNSGFATRKERDAEGLLPRPPGRAKKGCMWDGVLGQWVADSSQLPSTSPNGTMKKTGQQEGRETTRNTKGPNQSLKRDISQVDSTIPASSGKRRTKCTAAGSSRKVLSKQTKKPASAPFARSVLGVEIEASRKIIVALARSDLWSTDESVLLAAFEKITSFCEGESDDVEACRQAVYDTGVHMLVVKLLESHAGSLIFQQSGISLLFRLSTSTNNRIDEGLLSVGAVEAAVSAMLNFPNDVDIQAFGCVFLGNVTNSLDSWRRIQQQANNAPVSGSHAEDGFLFTFIFDILDRHMDSGMVLEAVAFLMERSMVTGGEEMMQLLSEKFHGRIGSLLLAKKKFGALQPNLNERIKSFFSALANAL